MNISHEIKILKEEFGKEIKFLKKFRYSPDKKSIKKILDYAKNS